ncbi:MAG: GuaB3 family IMP dehydrogenase-related protein [Candidatus Thermoplasmatota archaeon]|jgi:IMP dehydrogenase|nr:GuaB3 family IMP dehydrogenase-related protein [Candidatus Thermoplasmatota archaeon]MDP7265988.1 GuaB3 family IMP dehydrogenase-related protein [Candidatus Thermoplasmatota archaeon]
MPLFIGRNREARRAYGFDEVALVPGTVTVNPDEVNITRRLAEGLMLEIPFLASAMDGVVDMKFAGAFGKLGGLGVLNLEGIYTRYENPYPELQRIIEAPNDSVTHQIQEVYREPIKDFLIGQRVTEMKKSGAYTAVSAIPQKAKRYGQIAQEAGADVLVVQSTVTTARHISTLYEPVNLGELCRELDIPVIIGNCVTYHSALELMETGCAALLVGVGPGASCTTRGVLGIGVPQVTATIDCAAARDNYFKRTGKYVSIITDGGMSTGGDICKAFAAGADAVMLGSTFARAREAPGKGYHWGMATPHKNLPRGTRIRVGTTGSLEEILYGPARLDDGTHNLVGALKTSMGSVGAINIEQMQLTELLIAPQIGSEGKIFQKTQRVGMGK